MTRLRAKRRKTDPRMRPRIEWWMATAYQHSEADMACDRPWQCACGPCRAGREETGAKTHHELLVWGVRKQLAYERAMRGGEA